MGPTTGHDVLEDVLDVFQFVAHQLNALLETFQIDPDLIAVAGASAGGLCAFLAATQATPRPLANLSICPMGANFLASYIHVFSGRSLELNLKQHDDYLKPKTEPFFLNYPLFAASTAPNYIYPKSQELPVIAGSPLTPPHEPQNPRQALYPLYLQRGDWLDYYTGDHGLSERLRADRKRETIPQEHLDLFPQFGSLSQWPPTFFILAGADTVVPSHAAYHLRELLAEAGVDVTLRVGEGEEHLFDVLPTAEDKYGKLFDEAAAFLVKELRVHK